MKRISSTKHVMLLLITMFVSSVYAVDPKPPNVGGACENTSFSTQSDSLDFKDRFNNYLKQISDKSSTDFDVSDAVYRISQEIKGKSNELSSKEIQSFVDGLKGKIHRLKASSLISILRIIDNPKDRSGKSLLDEWYKAALIKLPGFSIRQLANSISLLSILRSNPTKEFFDAWFLSAKTESKWANVVTLDLKEIIEGLGHHKVVPPS